MDISLINVDSDEAFLDQVISCIKERLNNREAKDVEVFASQFFHQFPLDELNRRQLNDVYGSVYAWWSFVLDHDLISPKVRVFNPSIEEDGWLCDHTVVAVLQRDMPFLVDSIRMEINRRNIAIHTVNSTIFSIARDDKHQLVELADKARKLKNTKGKTYHKEALIYLEIDLHTSETEMRDLASSIESVLEDVTQVVNDYPRLLDQVEGVEKNLTWAPKGIVEGNLKESREFLRWMMDGHFTFLGYLEYEFVGQETEKALREIPEKRLGLFKQHGRELAVVAEQDFSPGMARFHLVPQVIKFSKSSLRSRVHRDAYSDYVVVKRYNKQGEICGESRFLGLYTPTVYTLSPTQIPLIRQKVAKVMLRSDLDPNSHDGKVLKQTLETFPRDELFQSSCAELHETVSGVVQIKERHRVRLFMRKDPDGKFVNCIVYIPRDVFSTRVREKIQNLISSAINAKAHEFTTYFSDSILARVHLVFLVDPEHPVEYDLKCLEAKIVDISRTWEDLLRNSLIEFHGEERGTRLFHDYNNAFSHGYRENFEARLAVVDIDTIEKLYSEDDIAMSLCQSMGANKNSVRFKVFHLNSALELSAVIPVLEHLGLRVIGEHPYKIHKGADKQIWLHDFNLVFGLPAAIDVHAARAHFQEAFAAIWRGQAESDAFNRLVLGARLNWRDVALLRAYASYMKQTVFNFSQTYIANTLANHLEITRNLMALFKANFDPRINQSTQKDKERIERLKTKVLDSLDKVDNLNEDRIIRRYLDLINATLRTNFFQTDSTGKPKSYISIKFSPRQVPDIPEPRPMYEIFVYSPRMEGTHLRGGKVSRGGLRWSDRLQDYRTEVLGLVKAQQVKNAVIVPSGAKGGFVVKQLPQEGGREAFLQEGVECYKIFIKGLLDLTDNLQEGVAVPPKQVIRHDEDDPYLVVAADKGTATFSDIANAISKEYNHWLGDAFASGGSQGYDHKGMGITARGAWVSVQRHFKEKGLNIQREDFTVIGIGDMAGDVFGNGMLMSEHIHLVSAFNHLHIFIDPNPDVATSFVERQRLFETPGTTWADYNRKLISKGGGIFTRATKSIIITPEMKQCFGIRAEKLTPNELIRALLQAPVDLIWNGGIGTYVKAATESHADVGDKANDGLRINGNQLRCRVFGEGGNLGLTQLGRIEYCLNGGACNTDFIDNAAGVDCSDHEVNIKILLDSVVANGNMTDKQRNQLLVEMTDTVAELVLSNNYQQTQAITIAEHQAHRRIGEYRRFINAMEASGRLNRQLEFIPEDEELLERQSQGKSLTRPELSVLISYAKVMLKEALATSDMPQDEYVVEAVEAAFPAVLRQKFKSNMYHHILKEEIVATQVANDMVNTMGISFCQRLMESTAKEPGEVAKAYVIAREIYQLEAYWQEVEALDYQVPAVLQIKLMNRMMRRVRRATRWFLRNRRSRLEPVKEIALFAPSVQNVLASLPRLLRGEQGREWAVDYRRLLEQGVPEPLACKAAIASPLYLVLGVVDAALQSNADPLRVGEVYFVLGDHLGLNGFANKVSDVKVENHWQAKAREALMEDLESQLCALSVSMIRLAGEKQSLDETIDLWCAQHQVLIARWKAMIGELQGAPGSDFAVYSIALRELLEFVQASQYCESVEDSRDLCVEVV